MNYLSGSMDEITYGEVRIKSAAYQDDIFSAQAGISGSPGSWERGN